jgi:hypothetical protein
VCYLTAIRRAARSYRPEAQSDRSPPQAPSPED